MEPFFQTRITYEVVTAGEAFNGTPQDLASMVNEGAAAVIVFDRAVHELDAAEVMDLLAQGNE